MIKIEQDKDSCVVEIDGDIMELAADTACILSSIYSSIHEKDHDAAEAYARLIVRLIIDPDSDVFEPYEKEK